MNVLSKPEASEKSSGDDTSSSSPPARHSLLDLPNEMLERLFEYFGFESMKLMRDLQNRRLYAATQTCKTSHFKHWSLGRIPAEKLKLFVEQVLILKGIKIDNLLGDKSEADRTLETLIRERPELESVEILSSKCTDSTLQLLVQNSNIRIVRLGGANITGNIQIPSSLTSTSVIEVLSLSGCRNLSIHGIVSLLNKIGETLKVLNLSRTLLSFSDADTLIFGLPVLEELDLGGCRSFTDAGVIGFLNNTGSTLRKLDLNSGNISLSGIESLTTSLPLLEQVNLSGCKNMTEANLLAFLGKIGGSLRIIDLSRTGVSLSDIESSPVQLPVLEQVYLSYCHSLTNAGVIGVLKRTGGNLRILHLNNTDVSLCGIESLTKSFSLLEELNLSRCKNITEAGIFGLLNKTGGALRILNLNNTSISLSDIGSMTLSLHLLAELNLSECKNLTEAGFTGLLNKTGGNLKIINLSNTNVALSEIESLASSFHKLQQLNLSHCKNLTESGTIGFLNKTGGALRILNLSNSELALSSAESLTTSFPALEKFELTGCKNTTEAGLVAFLERTSGKLIVQGRWQLQSPETLHVANQWMFLGGSKAVEENIKSVFPNLRVW